MTSHIGNVVRPIPVQKKVALILGVANQRSIAWSCVQAFLRRADTDWHVLLTYQNDNDKARSKIHSLMAEGQTGSGPLFGAKGKILGAVPFDVTVDASVRTLFHDALPEALHRCYHQDGDGSDGGGDDSSTDRGPQLHAVIHSIAFAPELRRPLLETTREAFLQAHEVSAYSLIQVARGSLPYMTTRAAAAVAGTVSTHDGQQQPTSPSMGIHTTTTSLTALSYLGATRAIPGYNVMGPAKASLESVVRGLALEMGGSGHGTAVRVNAVRAGPIPTLSSKGGITNFDLMRRDVELRAPLGRNVTAEQVASTVYHVAAEADGMTGQTIEVDGGYSVVAGPINSMHA